MSFLVRMMSQIFHISEAMSPAIIFDPIPSLCVWYCAVESPELDDDLTFRSLLSRLSAAEQQQIAKFVFSIDQKRAFLSLVLQHAIVMQEFPFSSKRDYQLLRTKENKPFLSSDKIDVGFWNYNVSHHGNYVCIAASKEFLIGVDIVDITTRSRGVRTCEEYLMMFRQQLTSNELKFILSQGTEELQFTAFFLYWSLKEAFIKAIGLGLGFDLLKVEFEVQELTAATALTGSASASIHGIARTDWRFDYFSIDDKHLASVAQGPLSDAIESYKNEVWQDRVIDQKAVCGPHIDVASELKTVSQLLVAARLL
jgi:4'-phosphopantetheinyl transferase